MTRILVVDDNPQVRTAIRMCLQLNKRWSVCGEAGNGLSAIDMVRRLKPDVVLLDYAMPEMNGVEAAREIATIATECAVLLFTMYASAQLAVLATNDGVGSVIANAVS